MSISSGILMYLNIPPDEGMLQGEMDYRKDQGKRAHKPGDKYSIFSAIVGSVIGLFLGGKTGNPFGFVIGLIIGGLVGTLAGPLVGNYIDKYKKRME
ncbi:glycine zipper domain-containing protein [Chloroflexota bacterium]